MFDIHRFLVVVQRFLGNKVYPHITSLQGVKLKLNAVKTRTLVLPFFVLGELDRIFVYVDKTLDGGGVMDRRRGSQPAKGEVRGEITPQSTKQVHIIAVVTSIVVHVVYSGSILSIHSTHDGTPPGSYADDKVTATVGTIIITATVDRRATVSLRIIYHNSIKRFLALKRILWAC